MSNSERTPYGSWKSPITADLIVGETVRLGQIALDGENTYWIEMRPAEGEVQFTFRTTMTSGFINKPPKLHQSL